MKTRYKWELTDDAWKKLNADIIDFVIETVEETEHSTEVHTNGVHFFYLSGTYIDCIGKQKIVHTCRDYTKTYYLPDIHYIKPIECVVYAIKDLHKFVLGVKKGSYKPL